MVKSGSGTRLRLAVLHGGPSSEHDISVMSAAEILAALRQRGHHVEAVWVDRQGAWHFGGMNGAGHEVAQPLQLPAALGHLAAMALDSAFLGFHGTYGEDGRIQAALDLAGVPFTGSDMTASAVAMDKPLARRILVSAGLLVPAALDLASVELTDGPAIEAAADRIVARLGLPTVIKVAAGGSSLGVEIAATRAEVCQSLTRLRQVDDVLLCEAFISGVELTAGVLHGVGGGLEALPIVEIAPRGQRWFDYEAKYDPSLTEEIVPARIAPHVEERAREIGRVAHLALGCRGVSRTDLILSTTGELYVLETNTLPGLTSASLLPKAAAAIGCGYGELLERIIAGSACSKARVWPADGRDSP